MVLTKIPGSLITDASITSADITDSTITNAKMAVDPANASNLSSGDVPLAQLGNVPDPDLSSQSDDIALLAFKTQANGNLARYNLVDQSVDAFEDASGVDSGSSTNADRNTAGKYYSGSSTTSATGGTVTSYGAYTVNEFTASGNFVIGKNGTVDYLIVGGGASGSSTHGASGGGGGGVLTNTSQALTAGTLAVVVGAEVTVAQTAGNQSSFNSQTASGGAAGTGYGGTGGASGAPTANSGGSGHVTSYAETGGGAGGAGGTGSNSSPSSKGGDGGTGLQNNYATGSNRWYGWGGSGGGARDPSQGSPSSTWGTTPPSLTIGGNNLYHGTAPIANRGGGGSGNNSGGAQAGSAGVVVIRYTTGEFDVENYNDMTLVSNFQTAAAQPTKADVVMTYSMGAGTASVNTDLVASVSRDGGTSYTAVTLASQGTTGGHTILTANNVDISGQPAGTSMVWKVATTSQSVSKQTRIHAVSLGWS